jgi:DNA-binding NarL/FixJ family response regulator
VLNLAFLNPNGGVKISFSSVFDTKKHTNVKCKASYRRINKYYKGIEKTKAVKERRKKILALLDQGLTIKLTAQQLKVSERTVKRDLAEMRVKLRKKRKQQLKYSNREFIN